MTATTLVQRLQRTRKMLNLDEAFVRLDKYAVLIIDDRAYIRKKALRCSS